MSSGAGCTAAALLFALAGAASAWAAPFDGVDLQQDPFERLQRIEAGLMSGDWSSLPQADPSQPDCRQIDSRLRAHAVLLGQSSDARAAGESGRFSLIDPRYRARVDATAQWSCLSVQLAMQRRSPWQGNPFNDGSSSWTWDGSSVSWRFDPHWQVGVGRVARHWGPGWDGSLILGTAARPFFSFGVEARSGALAPDSFWHWLGEVDLSVFFGWLDERRGDYDDPYLMGARVQLRPWPSLQIGLSRVAMWGGDGRDNSWRTFWTALSGRDNQDGPGAEQPGNQLAGIDLRWDVSQWTQWLGGVALYVQWIGEDEAGNFNLPSKYMRQVGAEWRRDDRLLFVEYNDTTAKIDGVAYNHHIYTDGFRFNSRSLGHWADGDSKLWSVGALARRLWGGQGLAVLRHGVLNDAGANAAWPQSRLSGGALQWRIALHQQVGLTLGVSHDRLALARGGTDRDTQLRLQLDFALD